MLQRLSENLSHYLVKQNAATEEKREIIQYGLQSLISTGLAVVLILVIALLLGQFWESVVFLVGFVFLRRYTGGYHAGTYFRCFATTILAYLLNIGLIRLMDEARVLPVLIVILAISIVPIFLFSPHVNPRHPMTEREIRLFGRISRLGTLAVAAVALATALLGSGHFALFICMSLFTASVTLVVGMLHDRRKERT